MLRIAAPEASPLSERRVRAGPHPPSECSRNVFCPFPVLWMLACQFPSLFPRTNSRNHSSSAHSRSRHHTESFTHIISTWSLQLHSAVLSDHRPGAEDEPFWAPCVSAEPCVFPLCVGITDRPPPQQKEATCPSTPGGSWQDQNLAALPARSSHLSTALAAVTLPWLAGLVKDEQREAAPERLPAPSASPAPEYPSPAHPIPLPGSTQM